MSDFDFYPRDLRPMAEQLQNFDVNFGLVDLAGGFYALSVAIDDEVTLYLQDAMRAALEA